MQFLITGGAGFIGSTVARRLLAEGHDVRVLDNFETGKADNVPAGVPVVRADVTDAAAVYAACAGADVVIHQAAMVSVSLSVTEPSRCYDVNVMGTRNVLEGARRAGCKRVVMASSAAVYGDAPALPKREDLPVMPLSPYAYAKWQNEVDAAYYDRFCGLETVCFRYFNVFGPRQDPASPYSGVISIACDRLLADRPFTVYGDGQQSRDFVYVEDVAAAVVKGATTPGIREAVINVGRGESVTVLELLATLGEALGKTPDLRFEPARAGDVRHSRSDASRLATQLGLRAEVSLADGLAATVAWLRAERAAAR